MLDLLKAPGRHAKIWFVVMYIAAHERVRLASGEDRAMVWKSASLPSSRRRVSSKGWVSPSCCGSFLLNRWPTSNLRAAR